MRDAIRKIKSSNSILAVILSILLIIFIAAGAFLCIEIIENIDTNEQTESAFGQEKITFNGKEYLLKPEISTFLVLGLDKFSSDEGSEDSYKNDMQADFLMLFVFDDANKKYTVIHINRDTMTEVNELGVAGNKIGSEIKQIALAHTYGNGKDVSCHNTANAVSTLLKGIDIDHYASLALDSVATFNDLVGGVEVTVLHDFTGVDDTLIKGETVTLMGEHALNYVKERRGVSDSTNAERMERQKQYLDALRIKTFECMDADDEFIAKAAVKMADYIISDRSVNQLKDLAQKVKDYEFSGLKDIKGESKIGDKYVEFYPDEAALEKMVIDLFYNEAKK